jgi:2-polyprenyl-3-methyl-5-hydroxy-6-metoxy-1,4-benzoquinol methylase
MQSVPSAKVAERSRSEQLCLDEVPRIGPERYDRGVELLSRGRIGDVYSRMAVLAASPGKHVLDLGCGTGGVALPCAARGAHVVAIDSNAGMLEIAGAPTGLVRIGKPGRDSPVLLTGNFTLTVRRLFNVL